MRLVGPSIGHWHSTAACLTAGTNRGGRGEVAVRLSGKGTARFLLRGDILCVGLYLPSIAVVNEWVGCSDAALLETPRNDLVIPSPGGSRSWPLPGRF